MSLKGLNKQQAGRVMGIDCSTHSLAYTIIQDDKPVKWGKIKFEGSDVFERMHDATKKMKEFTGSLLLEGEPVDYIAFESAILAKVANADVTIKLAMMYGICISHLMGTKTKVVTVKPLEWASYVGVPNLTKAEKEAIKTATPGMSASWYQNKGRELRKQRIIDFANNKWEHWNVDDSDVADSCSIGWHAYNKLTTR